MPELHGPVGGRAIVVPGASASSRRREQAAPGAGRSTRAEAGGSIGADVVAPDDLAPLLALAAEEGAELFAAVPARDGALRIQCAPDIGVLQGRGGGALQGGEQALRHARGGDQARSEEQTSELQ